MSLKREPPVRIRRIVEEWKRAGINLRRAYLGEYDYDVLIKKSPTIMEMITEKVMDKLDEIRYNPREYMDIRRNLVIEIELPEFFDDIFDLIYHYYEKEIEEGEGEHEL